MVSLTDSNSVLWILQYQLNKVLSMYLRGKMLLYYRRKTQMEQYMFMILPVIIKLKRLSFISSALELRRFRYLYPLLDTLPLFGPKTSLTAQARATTVNILSSMSKFSAARIVNLCPCSTTRCSMLLGCQMAKHLLWFLVFNHLLLHFMTRIAMHFSSLVRISETLLRSVHTPSSQW